VRIRRQAHRLAQGLAKDEEHEEAAHEEEDAEENRADALPRVVVAGGEGGEEGGAVGAPAAAAVLVLVQDVGPVGRAVVGGPRADARANDGAWCFGPTHRSDLVNRRQGEEEKKKDSADDPEDQTDDQGDLVAPSLRGLLGDRLRLGVITGRGTPPHGVQPDSVDGHEDEGEENDESDPRDAAFEHGERGVIRVHPAGGCTADRISRREVAGAIKARRGVVAANQPGAFVVPAVEMVLVPHRREIGFLVFAGALDA